MKCLHNPRVWLAVILLFAILLRLYFFVGLNWADDPGYVGEANEVLKGNFHPENNLNRRVVTYLPIAFSFYLFGINELSAVVFSLLCSLAEIILIFFIGKHFLNEKIALLAAALLAVYPLNVNYSTMAMGDVPLSFFGSLSIFLFLSARKKAQIEREAPFFYEKMKGWFLFFCAGFIAYMSYLIKELGLLLPFFMFVCFLYDIIKNRALNFNYSFVFIGFLAAFFVEAGIYYSTGAIDPFVSFNQGIGFFSEAENLHGLSLNLFYYPYYMFNTNFIFSLEPLNNRGYFNYNYFGPFFYMVAISVIYLLLKRKKYVYIIISWLLVIFLWMQFGTMSYKSYVPMHRLDRHLTIITIPSILLFSAALYEFIKSAREAAQSLKIATLLISAGAVFTLIFFWLSNLNGITRFQRGTTEDVREIYENVKMVQEPVYTSEGAVAYMKFLSGFQKTNFRVIPELNCDNIHNSYVVTNADLGWMLSETYIDTLPICVLDPPKNWKLIKIIDTAFKEKPYNKFNPKIYYVP